MSKPPVINPPATSPGATASPTPAPKLPPKPQNPALRMLGLPPLPKKLPSRNWTIFWTLTLSVTGAIVYDKREKKRVTAKWVKAVAPLSKEPIGGPSQLPRKLTIYLEAPPGDGLRVAQDHFIEYAKPVLAASGLDWDFVQGRQQGDVRAAVAEKIRMSRKATERPDEELPQTDETIIQNLRKRIGLAEYDGVRGDIVVGRHAWKEYIRGLHEGWLGPLDPPAQPVTAPTEPEIVPEPIEQGEHGEEGEQQENKPEKEEEEKKEKKPERPPQPPPHNTIQDYATAFLPTQVPSEFSPSITIPFPHRLGFSNTFVRLGWFFNRRKLADEVGRSIAAACFAGSRDYREADGQYEQDLILKKEEEDWPKATWKPDEPETEAKDADVKSEPPVKKEKIWISEIVSDQRIMHRMRKFEITEEAEERAKGVVVTEEEIEGWIKGSLRSLWRWGASSFENEKRGPNVGNLDDE